MPFGVALGLDQHALRAERQLLGLDDATDAAAVTEGVVGRAVGGLELRDGGAGILIDDGTCKGHDRPPRALQPGVDPCRSG